MFGFRGKVAVVTGSSRSIGRGIALALARCGCAVTVNYRVSRGVIDEQDVKSVLEREGVTLDWSYLRGRAERAGVWAQLQMIRNV